MPCLLCHWEPNEPKEGNHLPHVGSRDDESGIYVCVECATRSKTVEHFGLTVEELRKAAETYKKAWASTVSAPRAPQEG
jgi:hypothetical protein